jgi:hypothetical protein
MTEYEVEYGSISPVGFAKCKMYNEDGSESMCACGQLATSGFVGEHSFIDLCNECEKNLRNK